ncbi:hypothetical protein [Pedobacter psychrodurus]|uniref:glycosyl-4,4'-diaponeurosporenoate acyltransferase CrtO family protein n=1 Tax=Pedobacter psychrodurus TaxID=2530456 RepID=UPI0039776C51
MDGHDVFSVSTLHALYYTQYIIAILITLLNIIYNIYPIMLQQYNRLRMVQMRKKQNMRS